MKDYKFKLKDFDKLPKKQKVAIYTLGGSLLAFLLVVVIASVLMFSSSKKPDSSSSSSDTSSTSSSTSSSGDYVENKSLLDTEKLKDTLLAQAENTDANYLKETLFVGDSNTERLLTYGLISIDNFVGKTGMSVQGVATEACVYFKNDDKSYTIPNAIAKMKPRRVVMTFGTNDADAKTTPEAFVANYQKAIDAIVKAYPHCDIIINSVPPVAKQRTYKNITMETIDSFNVALANMAQEKGYKFVYSGEALRGDDGYGKAVYFSAEDGIHLREDGARAMLDYVRTHPYDAKDRRPDTKNIPQRRSAPSTVISSSSSEPEAEKAITATYNVQVESSKALGTLKSDNFDKKTTYTHTFTEKNPSIKITAVPAEGYEFDTWSDGVKDATRTDKDLKKSVKVTAKFKAKAAALTLKIDKSNMTITAGETVTITSTLAGDGAADKKEKVVWKLNGVHVKTGSSYSVKFDTATAANAPNKIEVSVEGVATPITITVTVNPPANVPLAIKISGPTTAKPNDVLQYSANVTGTGADASKTTWTVGGTAQPQGATMTFTPTANGSYTIVAKNGTASQTITLVVSTPVDPITVSATGTINATVGDPCSYTATVKGTGADASKTTWSVTGAGTASGNGATFSFTPSVAGTYTIVATNSGVSSAAVSLTVAAKPVVNSSVAITTAPEGDLTNGTEYTFVATITNGEADSASKLVWKINGTSVQTGGTTFNWTPTPGFFTVSVELATSTDSRTYTVN